MLDPAELDFDFDKPATFVDLETGRDLYIDPAAARQQYQQKFTAHAAEIEQICRDLGIELPPAVDVAAAGAGAVRFPAVAAARRPAGARAGDRRRRGGGEGRMSFLAPLYVAGHAGGRAADPVPPDPAHAAGQADVQLADVPRALAAADHPPQPAEEHPAADPARRGAWRCWRWRSPGRSSAAGADAKVNESAGRRIAILVDTSASMRRGDLWQQAAKQVEQAYWPNVTPADEVALLFFDKQRPPGDDLRRVRTSWSRPPARDDAARPPGRGGADVGAARSSARRSRRVADLLAECDGAKQGPRAPRREAGRQLVLDLRHAGGRARRRAAGPPVARGRAAGRASR